MACQEKNPLRRNPTGSTPPAATLRIALVQGESFRCLAVAVRPGRWVKAGDGAELPRVLEILRVEEDGDLSSVGKQSK
jgi:hypothetical protein